MGKILETTYHETVEKVTGFYEDLVNNSFYVLNDKKPVIGTYYPINWEASSLDPGSKLAYNNIGPDCPLRFDEITDFIFYTAGIKVELNTDNGEFGLEADKISGEFYVLPNTIIPKEGEFLKLDHIYDGHWLFMVKDVQRDTLENGSNAYKVSYALEYTTDDALLPLIVNHYKMIEKREGTEIATIVRSEDYKIAKYMDDVAVHLKQKYQDLFYDEKVQTFIYTELTSFRVYDEYMIEFLIRNKILDNGGSSYIHVDHKLPLRRTFSIDYDDTFFRCFEKRDKSKLFGSVHNASLGDIKAFGTIFDSRYEIYNQAVYDDRGIGYQATCISDEIINNVMDHRLVEGSIDDPHPIPLWYNIITKYFYHQFYTTDEVKCADEWRFESAVEAFYMIPILIKCLEEAIEDALR